METDYNTSIGKTFISGIRLPVTPGGGGNHNDTMVVTYRLCLVSGISLK